MAAPPILLPNLERLALRRANRSGAVERTAAGAQAINVPDERIREGG